MKSLKSNRLLKGVLATLCCSVAFVASSSWAVLVTWSLNPGGLNADVGSNTASFTQSGMYTITAYGYNSNGSPHELHYKNLGVSERGLGLAGVLDFEPQPGQHFMTLSLVSILSQGFTNGQIMIGSVQAGESWSLYGSNTLGTLGTLLNAVPFGSSTDEQFVNVPNFGTYQYISVVSNTGDVLPVMFQATVVPIPEAASVIPVLCLITAATALEVRRRRRVTS